jgi:hypothetical protein
MNSTPARSRLAPTVADPKDPDTAGKMLITIKLCTQARLVHNTSSEAQEKRIG